MFYQLVADWSVDDSEYGFNIIMSVQGGEISFSWNSLVRVRWRAWPHFWWLLLWKLLRNSKVQENVMMNHASKAIADSRLFLLCRQCFNLTFVMSAGTQDSKYKSDIMILSSVCLWYLGLVVGHWSHQWKLSSTDQLPSLSSNQAPSAPPPLPNVLNINC